MVQASECAVPVPLYMEKGSTGTMVNMVLAILVGWERGCSDEERGVICDGVLGDHGVDLVKDFQGYYGLDAHGGVGPDTRGVLHEEFDFNFVEVARTSGGSTTFVQPDGSKIVWPPPPPAE